MMVALTSSGDWWQGTVADLQGWTIIISWKGRIDPTGISYPYALPVPDDGQGRVAQSCPINLVVYRVQARLP